MNTSRRLKYFDFVNENIFLVFLNGGGKKVRDQTIKIKLSLKNRRFYYSHSIGPEEIIVWQAGICHTIFIVGNIRGTFLKGKISY